MCRVNFRTRPRWRMYQICSLIREPADESSRLRLCWQHYQLLGWRARVIIYDFSYVVICFSRNIRSNLASLVGFLMSDNIYCNSSSLKISLSLWHLIGIINPWIQLESLLKRAQSKACQENNKEVCCNLALEDYEWIKLTMLKFNITFCHPGGWMLHITYEIPFSFM